VAPDNNKKLRRRGGLVAVVYYFTHTQIRVDPAIPVRDWRLSDDGRARILRVTGAAWMARVSRVVASSENRVIEAAGIFANRRGLPVVVDPGFDDSDRPLSEFLSVAELDKTVDDFFAAPGSCARPGWQTATDVQRRIVAAVDDDLATHADSGDVLIVGHGRVGTVLLCHLAGLPISRELFQPTAGGNLFAFDRATRKVQFRWRIVAPPL
jgi:broad specificity phosphatase PhoE